MNNRGEESAGTTRAVLSSSFMAGLAIFSLVVYSSTQSTTVDYITSLINKIECQSDTYRKLSHAPKLALARDPAKHATTRRS